MMESSDDRSSEANLSKFKEWLDISGFQLSPKLEIRDAGQQFNLGAFAVSHISADELLFVVPRSKILSSSTCSISSFLTKHRDELKSHSGWLPQILAVMYERIMEQSNWRPYLQVSPNFGVHQLPFLWTSDERKQLLKGTGLEEKVKEDLKKMEEEWKETLIPFIRKFIDIFAAAEFQSLQFFKETVAFILAYSFTEPFDENDSEAEDSVSEEEAKTLPYMVPMADILNHSPRNNAEVQYKMNRLEIRAISDIPPGKEVFNTYGGLSNWELLHCYGFSLPPQILRDTGFDSVPICIKNHIDEGRWEHLCLASLVSEGASTNMAFDGEGFVNPESAAILLSVTLMSDEEFKQRIEMDDDDDDDDDDLDSPWISCLVEELEDEVGYLAQRSQFHKLPSKWIHLLHGCAEQQLKLLPQENAVSSNLSSLKIIFASFVCLSQYRLLKELLQHLPSDKSKLG